MKTKDELTQPADTEPSTPAISENEHSFFNQKPVILPPEEKSDRQKFLECFSKFDI